MKVARNGSRVVMSIPEAHRGVFSAYFMCDSPSADFARADEPTDSIDQYPAVRKYADYDPAIDIRAGAHSDYGQHVFQA